MPKQWTALFVLCFAAVAVACTAVGTRGADDDSPLDVLASQDAPAPAGTAFALGNDQYVTAAHVFDSLIGSRYGNPILLDSRSALYEVENIVRYSADEDFVVFTARRKGTAANGARATSDRTAAERLLQAARGKAGAEADIRVQPVLYALNVYAYREILGTDASTVFAPEFFQPEDSITGAQARNSPIRLDEPIPYPRFAAQVVAARDEYFTATLNRWLRANARKVLLGGSFATQACDLLDPPNCPLLAPAADDIVLKPDEPQVVAQTSAGPTLQTYWLDGVLILHRRTADTTGVSAEKLAMGAATRWTDHFPVIELDTPAREERYIDLHNRQWQVRTWSVRDQDVKLIGFTRPVTGGFVALFRLVPTSLVHAATLHLKIIANIEAVTPQH